MEYFIYIHAFADEDVNDLSEAFHPLSSSPPSIMVTFPNGGLLEHGSNFDIVWSSLNVTNENIELWYYEYMWNLFQFGTPLRIFTMVLSSESDFQNADVDSYLISPRKHCPKFEPQ